MLPDFLVEFAEYERFWVLLLILKSPYNGFGLIALHFY